VKRRRYYGYLNTRCYSIPNTAYCAGVSHMTLHGNVIDPNERRKTSWRREKEERFWQEQQRFRYCWAGRVRRRAEALRRHKQAFLKSFPSGSNQAGRETTNLFGSGKVFLARQSEQCFASVSAGVFTRSIL
jgi:hypothetical protein